MVVMHTIRVVHVFGRLMDLGEMDKSGLLSVTGRYCLHHTQTTHSFGVVFDCMCL